MTLQQLQYFLASMRHGTFSAAADALHIAQPSLSDQIRRLEGELGVPLFTRVGRGIVPTGAARALEPYAEQALAAVEGARDSVAEVRELRGGTITFGMFNTARLYGVIDVIEELRSRHPSVRVRFIGLHSSVVAEAVRSGRMEAAIVTLPIDDAGLDVTPIMRDEELFVSAHPWRLRETMSIERFAEVPLILYDAAHAHEDPLRRQLAERAQDAGVRLEVVIEVEHMESALDLAARGVGDTIASRAVTLGRRFPRDLQAIGFAEPLYTGFAIVTRRGATVSPGTRLVIELVTERLKQAASRIRRERAPRSEPVSQGDAPRG